MDKWIWKAVAGYKNIISNQGKFFDLFEHTFILILEFILLLTICVKWNWKLTEKSD